MTDDLDDGTCIDCGADMSNQDRRYLCEDCVEILKYQMFEAVGGGRAEDYARRGWLS